LSDSGSVAKLRWCDRRQRQPLHTFSKLTTHVCAGSYRQS